MQWIIYQVNEIQSLFNIYEFWNTTTHFEIIMKGRNAGIRGNIPFHQWLTMMNSWEENSTSGDLKTAPQLSWPIKHEHSGNDLSAASYLQRFLGTSNVSSIALSIPLLIIKWKLSSVFSLLENLWRSATLVGWVESIFPCLRSTSDSWIPGTLFVELFHSQKGDLPAF